MSRKHRQDSATAVELHAVNGHADPMDPKGRPPPPKAQNASAKAPALELGNVETFCKVLEAFGIEHDEHDTFIKIATEGPSTAEIAGTDAATARLLAQTSKAPLIYIAESGRWQHYDGAHWSDDDSRRLHARVKALAFALQERARMIDDQKPELDSDKIRSWAKRLQNKGGMNSALEYAQHSSVRRIADFDRELWSLNCANGTIDLKSGKLQPSSPLDLHRKVVAAEYDPEAKAPRFERFLAEILPDQSVRDFVQRFLGRCLTGVIGERPQVLVGIGQGRNGKSVLAETVRSVLGGYSGSLPIQSLMNRDHGTGNDIARLVGARFVVAKEAPKGAQLDEARLKDMTGGDAIQARFLHKEWFDYVPQYKLFLHSNELPEIRGTDNGIWSRLALVRFEQKFEDLPENGVRMPGVLYDDPTLAEQLKGERAGILAWLVAGCLAWQAGGLNPPAAVKAALKEWREASDTTADFVDCCTEVPTYSDAIVKVDALYLRYVQWCKGQGHKPLAKNYLTPELVRLGWQFRRTGTHGRHWLGRALRSETNSDD